MKKLYVLVFLVMTMGKIFGSDQIISDQIRFNNLRLEEAKKNLKTKIDARNRARVAANKSAQDKKLSARITTFPSDPIPADLQREYYEKTDIVQQYALKIAIAELEKAQQAHAEALITHKLAEERLEAQQRLREAQQREV